MIEADILNLDKAHSSLIEVQTCALDTANKGIQQALLERGLIPLTLELFCFLQLLSKCPPGRTYLGRHGNIVEILFAALTASVDCEVSEKEEQENKIKISMQWMALSCLEGLSHSEHCLEAMMRIGVHDWLIRSLPSVYAVESGLELLINLLQQAPSDPACEMNPEALLKLCESLREDKRPKVRLPLSDGPCAI